MQVTLSSRRYGSQIMRLGESWQQPTERRQEAGCRSDTRVGWAAVNISCARNDWMAWI